MQQGAQNSSSVSRRLTERLWSLVQFLALGGIFVSMLLSGRSKIAGPRDWTASEDPTLSQNISAAVVPAKVSALPRSITSRVVVLPQPAANGRGVEIEVETRQFRFERSSRVANALPLRQPAAVTDQDSWKLFKIERRNGSVWESVGLIRNDFQQTLGSVFVELEAGVNEFVVIFRDRQGREASYPVRIKHAPETT
ncbi:MAG: hypothetical protein JST16_09460 [Bdellovibrionales bacterium]|nr:hypothetical protein [Bdellovibrionales bacterium]